ncbi:MAG: type II CRISPR RNA-guided endonuclease Cas9 [Planctomycetes bacterium]|nr:type II CRISPR RNA-guided endonuclease Cas9 [Planctomycetota bacterium]
MGWAALACDENGEAFGFLDGQSVGSHVFDAGVENYFGSGQGKEESRGAKRRGARMMRRQLQRRARRLAKTYNILAGAGLLPVLDVSKPKDDTSGGQREYEAALAKARDAAIKALDLELGNRIAAGNPTLRRQALENLPYLLRVQALDHKLSPFEIGRALFHLAQRRGFKSARKGGSKETDEERSTVLSAINTLWGELGRDRLGKPIEGKSTGARTLGERFLQLTNDQRRVRGNWTHRKMYQQEFAAIWEAQQKHHPDRLTDEVRGRLVGAKGDGGAIFYQRPLKLQDHLIGVCDILDGVKHKPAQRRAPWACLEAQRFRMLQKVNDLRITQPGREDPRLTDGERAKLIDVLAVNRRVTLKRPRDASVLSVPVLLNLPKSAKFNFGRDDADNDDLPDNLPGNRTAADLAEIFGESKWRGFSPAQQVEIVDACIDPRNDAPGTLAALARDKWGATEEQAQRLEEDFALEDDYCSLSREALRRLLPHMEAGKPYMTARLDEFGEDPRPPIRDLLPPVKEYLPTLRNPVVFRALSELRRVVNAVIRRHGKEHLTMIRIELAREMKKSKKQRDDILKRNKQRERERRKAAERVINECRDLVTANSADDVKPWDVDRVLLYEECGEVCPYTGASIAFRQLFNGEVDVEHIIPYSRSLDNSFVNKTLCYSHFNRNVKKRQTPHEACGHTSEWPNILKRVEKMGNKEKLKRFELHGKELENYLDDFTNAQLVNSAYASRLALDYLGTLFGLPAGKSHVADASGKQKIQVCNGRLTSLFRAAWGLNEILNDGNVKKRNDHRHHAVDAVCIGVTTVANRLKMEKAVKAFERSLPVGSHKQFSLRKGDVPPPWETFYDGTRQRIESANVSRRVDKKVSGALHAETLYSPRYNELGVRDAEGDYSHIRKFVHTLSADHINSEDEFDKKGRLKNKATIVDPAARKALQAKLAEVGGDPKKLEEDPARLPSGKPIYRVRTRKKNKTVRVAKGIHERFVESGENHHFEIVEEEGQWRGVVVPMMEAYRRQKARQPVVQREHGGGIQFVCSLVNGDAFLWEPEEGRPDVFRVRTIDATDGGKIWFVRNQDARKKGDILESDKQGLAALKSTGKKRGASQKGWFSSSPEGLRKGKFQKVTVTPLGEVRPVND